MALDLADAVSFDWFILSLRIAFIGLIYYFLYRVSRESIRELVAIGMSAPASASPVLPNATSGLEVIAPAESSLKPGKRLSLAHYTTIGRRQDNSLVLDDSFVSNAHAEIAFDGAGWWLMDLGSTNGTFLNGARVAARTQVSDGDIVQFGRVTARANL